jgi:hypothetical protein
MKMIRSIALTLIALTVGLAAGSGCDEDTAPSSTFPDAAAGRDAAAGGAAAGGAAGASDAGAGGADAEPSDAAPTDTGEAALTTFKVRLENVAPFTMLKSGSYDTAVGAAGAGPLAPGQAYEVTFTAGKGHKLSFASMFGASNDWVFGFDPGGLDLYANGAPVAGDVTAKVSLWDVGTEVDEEPGVGPHTGPKQSTSADGPGAVDPNNKVRKVPATITLPGGGTFTVPAVSAMIKVTLTPTPGSRAIKLRIENVSNDASTLMTTMGAQPVRISPGVWAVAAGGEPFFSEGMPDRGKGLEAIAEGGAIATLAGTLPPLTGVATGISPGVVVVHPAGMPIFALGQPDRAQGLELIAESGNIATLASALTSMPPASASSVGTFTTPVGAAGPGPAGPTGAYQFEVRAKPGDRLSFVTMFGWSNDWFFGTPELGLPLFDDAGTPVAGDLSAMLKLYDAGTELSEEPAVGPNTGPQQAAPTDGPADSDTNVREVPGTSYATPVTQHLKLTISL